ncbi:MAG: ribosome-associated translation inhibitor RaiA [Chloroflexi bacterium]|nr:ribosome-associated translation inhibitor RaiA [Chloroflexota bacterium]
MDVRTFAKNIDLNEEAELYIQKKIDRLARHLKPLSDAKLEVTRTSSRAESDRVVAQMTLTAGGRTLRGQESGTNLFAAIDAITDVMDRQIRRYKGKFYRSYQGRKFARTNVRQSEQALDLENREQDADPQGLGNLVRTKRFLMQPMTIEEAILQMEMLSHDFFMFYNSDASEYNVVYRRHDGDYSVIEPDLA